jgi:hypothetical protein
VFKIMSMKPESTLIRIMEETSPRTGEDFFAALVKNLSQCMDVAAAWVRTKALWVSVRNGPAILPTTVLGIPLQLLSPLMAPLPAWSVDLLMAATERLIFGNLKKYNLPKHPDGGATRLIKEGVAPAFDDGFVSALRKGKVTVLPKIERFEGGMVHLAGGQTVNPDAVIWCATGYSPGLESLVGHLGVLDTNYTIPCRFKYSLNPIAFSGIINNLDQ